MAPMVSPSGTPCIMYSTTRITTLPSSSRRPCATTHSTWDTALRQPCHTDTSLLDCQATKCLVRPQWQPHARGQTPFMTACTVCRSNKVSTVTAYPTRSLLTRDTSTVKAGSTSTHALASVRYGNSLKV